jgi:hypothetical protein
MSREAAMTGHPSPRRAKGKLRRLMEWLSYRPERHYMRGGRTQMAGG